MHIYLYACIPTAIKAHGYRHGPSSHVQCPLSSCCFFLFLSGRPETMDTDIDGLSFPTRSANMLSGEEYSSGQDHLLPIANVGWIMKRALPANTKISKEAKETMQECASEFISFVTVEAAGSCRRSNRQKVSGGDVCSAMSTLGLDNYADSMRRFLRRYKEQEGIRAADRGEGGSDNDNAAL